ncbi:2OG-Fe dioxygenase family protein [Streptomyces sp. NPDC003038]|uniref:2OG-Fe dioxygenase family protein n=1 Tax=unclassified Streptomyces TaxID=2593676 RepID=UPI0033A73033
MNHVRRIAPEAASSFSHGPAADPALDEARAALTSVGAHLMAAPTVTRRLHASPHEWARFGRHWDALAPDPYVSGGASRLRRYGHFGLTPSGETRPRPHDSFVQPEDSNPLFIGEDRYFEPLTPEFADDPLFRSLLRLLAAAASCLDDPPEWTVKVHPFRVVASAGLQGQPTPEGVHRDGVTLVSSLLISRRNAVGGQSAVFHPQGEVLLTTTMTEPGTLLLGDDRRTLHSVTPVHPVEPADPAYRDVLVVTLAS